MTALVQFAFRRCALLILDLGGTRSDWLPGYRIKIVDGNHLGASSHRIQEIRSPSGVRLPGMSLVVLDPTLMLAADVLVCENGHAPERSLFPEWLAWVEADNL